MVLRHVGTPPAALDFGGEHRSAIQSSEGEAGMTRARVWSRLLAVVGVTLSFAATVDAAFCVNRRGRITVRTTCKARETPVSLGDVTAVTAGTGLLGGGTSGDVSLSLDPATTDARYWKLGGNTGTTPGTDFVGTTDAQALELGVGGARAMRLEPTATSPNLIGGSSDNAATTGIAGATIGGGGTAAAPNQVSADLGTVPGGAGALASSVGQMAYASGSFAAPGDAQGSLYVLRNVTTDASFTELFLDGTSSRITVEQNQTKAFDILLVGRSDGGQVGVYTWQGYITRFGIVTTLSPLFPTVVHEDAAAWNPQVSIGSGTLRLVVAGEVGKTIRWVANVRTAEVTFP